MKTFTELFEEGRVRETYLGYRSADLRHKWAIRTWSPETYVDVDGEGVEHSYPYLESWYVSALEHEGKPVLVESCIDEDALIFSKREAEAYVVEHGLDEFEVVELYAVLRT